jgi:hypothetical protein
LWPKISIFPFKKGQNRVDGKLRYEEIFSQMKMLGFGRGKGLGQNLPARAKIRIGHGDTTELGAKSGVWRGLGDSQDPPKPKMLGFGRVKWYGQNIVGPPSTTTYSAESATLTGCNLCDINLPRNCPRTKNALTLWIYSKVKHSENHDPGQLQKWGRRDLFSGLTVNFQ